MVEYSQYQTDIFDWVENGEGDGITQARAGSGKSFTIKEAAKRIGARRVIFFSFNTHIKDALNADFAAAGMPQFAKTIHGFGYGVLLRAFGTMTVDKEGKKYREIARQYVTMTLSREHAAMLQNPKTREDAERLIKLRTRALVKLVNMARLTRTMSDDTAALEGLMRRFSIETDGAESDAKVIAGVRPVIGQGLDILERGKICDYTDMLFAPLVLNLPVPRFDWVFVDEAQDLNTCQRDLVLRARAIGGRFLFVGDEQQAIMGFAGADAHSYRAIKEATNATELKLSICYRCPSSHLSLARAFVPDIEDRPNAPLGTIATITESESVKAITEGSLTLCRTTAPLIGLCLKLIASGKPARVRGRDIASGLIELAERIAELGAQNGTPFLAALDDWENAQITKLSESEDNEAAITAVLDKCDALRVLYTERNAPTVRDLCDQIRQIFINDDESASITLCTIHRAKGLEADQVFILYPRMLPFAHPKMTEDDYEQERNLTYVALTRAKVGLTFIDEDGEGNDFDPIAHFGWVESPVTA